MKGKLVGRYAGISYGFVSKPVIQQYPYGFVLVLPWDARYEVYNWGSNAELIVVDGGKYCFKVTLNRPLAPDVIEPVACPYST